MQRRIQFHASGPATAPLPRRHFSLQQVTMPRMSGPEHGSPAAATDAPSSGIRQPAGSAEPPDLQNDELRARVAAVRQRGVRITEPGVSFLHVAFGEESGSCRARFTLLAIPAPFGLVQRSTVGKLAPPSCWQH